MRHTTYAPPQSRNHRQAVNAAIAFAVALRVLDTMDDFTIMQSGQEIVISRNMPSRKYPAIIDILALVAKYIALTNVLEDVHMHFDGESLSLYFTETSVS